MDPATILADVQLAITVGKAAYEFGQDAGPFLINAYEIAFQNKVLTPDERTAMRAHEASLRSDIDAAIAADSAS